MYRRFGRGVLRESNPEGGGGGPPAPPLGAGGSQPPLPPVPPAAPEDPEIKLTSKQLNERLARASRSQLKDLFGTDDIEAIKARNARLQALEQAEEERKRQEMTELQRYQADLDAEKARAAKIAEELANVKFETHVTGICAQLGIKNVGYAKWLVQNETEGLPDGKQLDVNQFLSTKLTGDPQSAAAFGVIVTPAKVPVNTSPGDPNGNPPPPPAPPGSGGGKGKDVREMSQSEFQAHLSSLGANLAPS